MITFTIPCPSARRGKEISAEAKQYEQAANRESHGGETAGILRWAKEAAREDHRQYPGKLYLGKQGEHLAREFAFPEPDAGTTRAGYGRCELRWSADGDRAMTASSGHARLNPAMRTLGAMVTYHKSVLTARKPPERST